MTVVCLSFQSACPVSDVGVLWPNVWIDQDATWYGGRPRSMSHCVRSGPSCHAPKGTQPITDFRPMHVCYAQTTGWIKMRLGREVGLSPGDIVLDGDLASHALKGHSTPASPTFRPMSIVAKRSPISATVEIVFEGINTASIRCMSSAF